MYSKMIRIIGILGAFNNNVPFRLTRDMVDGMGIFGVNGPMRRCSEATMRVLRDAKDAIMTILQVLIHDPLYKWAATPTRMLKAQGLQEQEDQKGVEDGRMMAVVNPDAERTILRIKAKLLGMEGVDGEPLTVEVQVAQLLQAAQDPELLSKMYVGWAPWL